MEKQKYYINVGTGEISQIPYENNDAFRIQANAEEISLLRAKMENMHNASWDTFIRSHVPIVPYHNDKANDRYDTNLTEAFEMLYQLGDEKTKSHIETMGILSDNHM